MVQHVSRCLPRNTESAIPIANWGHCAPVISGEISPGACIRTSHPFLLLRAVLAFHFSFVHWTSVYWLSTLCCQHFLLAFSRLTAPTESENAACRHWLTVTWCNLQDNRHCTATCRSFALRIHATQHSEVSTTVGPLWDPSCIKSDARRLICLAFAVIFGEFSSRTAQNKKICLYSTIWQLNGSMFALLNISTNWRYTKEQTRFSATG